MDDQRQKTTKTATLPIHARLPINRCNLPAVILGSLTFQRNPTPLYLDGVQALHGDFFKALDEIDDPEERSIHFTGYMKSCFLLDHLELAGFDADSEKPGRGKADYLRMLRGWMFDADGREAAVLKSWVESRFGLLPRNHKGTLHDFDNERYQNYLWDRSQGLYNTNALEAQFDLLYSYCQYEISRHFPEEQYRRLYRGINRIEDHEILAQPDRDRYILVLNNLNSFTRNRERADEFGDYILEADIPLTKLLFFPGLLPGSLHGEEEYLGIGGVYDVRINLI